MTVLELISEAWLLVPFVPDVFILSVVRKKAQTPQIAVKNIYRPGSGSQVKNEVELLPKFFDTLLGCGF